MEVNVREGGSAPSEQRASTVHHPRNTESEPGRDLGATRWDLGRGGVPRWALGRKGLVWCGGHQPKVRPRSVEVNGRPTVRVRSGSWEMYLPATGQVLVWVP